MTSSPKDRVRANIYKQLLMEEKRKGRQLSVFSVSLFVFGVVTASALQYFVKSTSIERPTGKYVSNIIAENNKSNRDVSFEHFYDDDLFKNDKVELSTDELFGLERQI